MSRVTTYVVTDAETGERTAWSEKAYAIAEVLSIVNKRYGSDPHAIGTKASFEGVPSVLCELPVDGPSLVYGDEWRQGKEFVDAVAAEREHRRVKEERRKERKARRG